MWLKTSEYIFVYKMIGVSMDSFSTTTKLEERLVISATRKRIPLGGSFELLPLCNMDCRMCFLRLSPKEMRAQGRIRTADEWLALAREAKEAGMLFLLLTGGEPFLYPEFARLYRGLAEMGLFLTLNTNGTLITEEYADLLAEHLPRRVNITLYGSSDEIYGRLCRNPRGFTQVMRAIHLLQERHVPVKLNGSLTPDNWEDLEKIQQIAHELDIPLEVDSYMFPSSRKGVCKFDEKARLTPEKAAEGYVKIRRDELSAEDFRELAKAMAECYDKEVDFPGECDPEPLPCRAGLSSFWINWKGMMTPCVFMDQPEIPVFECGFAKAWESVKQERDKLFLPSDCTKCGKRAFCTVCGACAYTETGNVQKRPDYMCAMTAEKLRLMAECADEESDSED